MMNRAELLENLEKLKAGYISLLNDLHIMKTWGKTQLEALYATKIGKFEVELLELKIQLKAFKKKIQWVHQEINLGNIPNFKEIEDKVEKMTETAYQEIETAKGKILFGKAVLSNLGSPEDSMELRKIFRNIAKSLHPDINPNITQEQKEIWLSFKDAYDNGDLERMKALKIVYAKQIEKTQKQNEELSEEEILLQTAVMKQGIAELEEQKRVLDTEFPFKLAEQIRDDEWVQEQEDRLRKEIKEFETALLEKDNEYQLLKESYE